MARTKNPPKEITESWLKLTTQQAEFSKHVLAGESKAESYRRAYNPDATPEAARNNGARISMGQAVSLYIKAEKEWIYAQNIASKDELLSYLSDSLRVNPSDMILPGGKLDPRYAHLVQAIKTGEDGIESVTLVPRAECGRQLASLLGFNEPDRVQVLSLSALVKPTDEEGEW